jgi:ataxin-3
LLQGQFYSAVDLAELATELDTMERVRMGEMGEDSPEYQRFIQVSFY